MISFYSTGFPLDKALEYVALNRPFVLNDLETQKAYVFLFRTHTCTILNEQSVNHLRAIDVRRQLVGSNTDVRNLELSRHSGMD